MNWWTVKAWCVQISDLGCFNSKFLSRFTKTAHIFFIVAKPVLWNMHFKLCFVNIKSYYELSQHKLLLFFITPRNPKTFIFICLSGNRDSLDTSVSQWVKLGYHSCSFLHIHTHIQTLIKHQDILIFSLKASSNNFGCIVECSRKEQNFLTK